jgi:Ser/Thr protein kinase RdoA (MazF antagonist)
MNVLSPYGKDPQKELNDVYGFESPAAFKEFLKDHIQAHYTIGEFAIESLHVAFGLAIKIRARESYYLKFASLTMHSHPEQLFPWLLHLQKEKMPTPTIVPTTNGEPYLSPLKKSDYKAVYLMTAIPGKPAQTMTSKRLQQYVELMARFHKLGSDYPGRNLGSIATWNGKLRGRDEFFKSLEEMQNLNQTLVKSAEQVVDEAREHVFPSTILHGDFRLCHVFFEGDQLTGTIDLDQSTQGERFVDLCYGLVSGAEPEHGSLLTYPQVLGALQSYHQLNPLSAEEVAYLKPFFALALLETLSELSGNVSAGTIPIEHIHKTEHLLAQILRTEQFLK